MSIESVGSFKEIMNNYSSKNWVKKADLTLDTPMKNINELGFNELSGSKNEKSYSELLTDSVSQVNNLQKEANLAMQKLATGKSKNIHETMIAVERAEIAFKTMNVNTGYILENPSFYHINDICKALRINKKTSILRLSKQDFTNHDILKQ